MPPQWPAKGNLARKGNAMADLIAIGYPDEATADEARRLATFSADQGFPDGAGDG